MDRDFDSFFKELVRERIDEMPCPPKEEVWEQIKTQLRAERRKEKNLNGLLWDSGNIGWESNGSINRDDIIKVAKSKK